MGQHFLWGAAAVAAVFWQPWGSEPFARRPPPPSCYCTCELEVTAVPPWQAQAGLLLALILVVFVAGCACGGLVVYQLQAGRPRTSKKAAGRFALYG